MIFRCQSGNGKSNSIASENIHFELAPLLQDCCAEKETRVTVNDVESNVKIILDGDEIDLV
jgi:hypothetical protein